MPRCDIQVLNGFPPKPSTKTKHWNQAMFELKKYGENIESMRDKHGVEVKDKSLRMLMMKDKSPQGLGGGNDQVSPSKQQQQQTTERYPITERVSFTPPVVEVTPASGGRSGERKDDIGAGSTSDAEVSSPGTPPSLQIDLEGSGHGGSRGGSGGRSRPDKSPSRGRAMPSGGRGLIGTISRNSQVSGSLDLNNESGLQAVVMGSPSISQSGGLKGKRKGAKAGDALSALISSLTKKKMGGQGGGGGGTGGGGVVGPTVHPGTAASIEGGAESVVSGGQDDAGKQKGGPAEESQEKTNSLFSSIYADRHKTAIALVDPNQKRPKRKTTKGVGNEPPSKKARLNNTASGVQVSTAGAGVGTKANGGSSTVGDLQAMSDPAAYVAKIQEYGSAVIGAFSKNANTSITATTTSSPSIPPSSTSAISNTLSSLRAEVPTVKTSVPLLPQEISTPIVVAVSSSVSGSTLTPPSIPMATAKPRSTTGGGKKKKRPDKNRGKSPHKVQQGGVTKPSVSSAPKVTPSPAVVSALAAAIAAPTTLLQALPPSSSTPTSGISTPSSLSSASTSRGGNLFQQMSQGASSRHDSPSSSGSGDVRGEAVAQGIVEEDANANANDFAEGTGLLADTVRKVNTSFLARVNQMTGSSEDMGYKYFMEKV